MQLTPPLQPLVLTSKQGQLKQGCVEWWSQLEIGNGCLGKDKHHHRMATPLSWTSQVMYVLVDNGSIIVSIVTQSQCDSHAVKT